MQHKICREDRAANTFHLGSTSVSVQVIDRRSQAGLALPVGKDELAAAVLCPLSQHGSGPIRQRNDPAGILTLALPHPQESESSAVDRCKRNVPPFQTQRLTDSQPGFQYEDGNVV